MRSFEKNMDKRTRLYKCRGTMYCFNNHCPFLRRFDSIHQVQFDMKSSGKKHCVSCGEPMLILNCDARKYVVKDDHISSYWWNMKELMTARLPPCMKQAFFMRLRTILQWMVYLHHLRLLFVCKCRINLFILKCFDICFPLW